LIHPRKQTVEDNYRVLSGRNPEDSELFMLMYKYGTDKPMSDYVWKYETHLEPIRDKVTSVLEIGVGSVLKTHPYNFAGNLQWFPHYKPGGSLRVWRDYFPNAFVFGIDIAEDCVVEENRIRTFIFNSASKTDCDFYLIDMTFDLIVDDGSHLLENQIRTFYNLFHRVREGGFYVVEDVGSVEFMDQVVPTLRPQMRLGEAVDFLLRHRVTGAPVVDAKGRLVGIITETDLLKLLAEGVNANPATDALVADFMTTDVVTVTPDTDIYYVAGTFIRNKFRRLPVVQDGRIVGAITRFDLLRVVQRMARAQAQA